MLRKLVLGVAAAAALAAVAAPTAASAKGGHHGHGHFSVNIGGFGPGFYGYGPGYYVDYGPDCYFKKVKVWSNKWQKFIWKTKQVCY